MELTWDEEVLVAKEVLGSLLLFVIMYVLFVLSRLSKARAK